MIYLIQELLDAASLDYVQTARIKDRDADPTTVMDRPDK